MTIKGFYAYPSSPNEIGQTIEKAIQGIDDSIGVKVESWKALDIVGQFISEKVLENIDACDFLVADITRLNFNVTYEIGYAIGRKKPIFLTKNESINESDLTIREVGIFDTLGYSNYQNSSELTGFFEEIISINPIHLPSKINTQSPVYLLEGKYKTDWATRIISRIKKAGIVRLTS